MRESALPAEIKHFAGRIIDVDSHEMMPAQQWPKEFGPVVKELTEAFLNNGETNRDNPNHPNIPDFDGDNRSISAETIMQQKGGWAPGAVDPTRRAEVMDAMGVGKQLMFPTGVGAYGVGAIIGMFGWDTLRFGKSMSEQRALGRSWMNAYNEWGVRAAKASERLRPVLPVLEDTVEGLMSATRRLIDQGIRAIWLPGTVPPGGRSPAHYDLDPFWDLLATSKVVPCLHIGGEGPFFQTMEWGNAQPFENFRVLGEFKTDPWMMSVNHLPNQNFTAVMTVGGVFDRHPALKLGVIETGAMWMGPLAELLDVWWKNGQAFGTAKSVRLPKSPSSYLQSNVRVSPFDFEPIGTYIERHPILEDMLCFATDYPHIEGGKNPAGRLYSSVKHLGPGVVEKFFVHNGQALFPQ